MAASQVKPWMRQLGRTGLQVSALGLGTVKLGRALDVKYPQPFSIPDQRAARQLLDCARDLQINLIDTAPAYGDSEARLGKLLRGTQQHWLVCSKVGEQWRPGPASKGESRWDFSAQAVRSSVEGSLRRLRRECLDIVLVHSNGDDRHIIEQQDTLQALAQLKQQGLVRCIGFSCMTVPGGLLAARHCDLVMVTCNTAEPGGVEVLDACETLGKGALVKKALVSGHRVSAEEIEAGMRLSLNRPGTSSILIGTINPEHLQHNVRIAQSILNTGGEDQASGSSTSADVENPGSRSSTSTSPP
jgi:aryl-alcohol dehydrogenase-like predicted oxidoreductase